MTIERTINIDGTEYPLTLSDEPKTLLAAKAAGRVVVGIGTDDWLPVSYVMESLPADEAWLEGVARRELGIPWKITETDRLIIREFSVDDCTHIPDDADDTADEAILKDPLRLQAYIDEQYAFFNCGMWAVLRKEDGRIVGMVSLIPVSDARSVSDHESVSDMRSAATSYITYPASDICGSEDTSYGQICELGYHIYIPYRRRGYAGEACARILELLSQKEISVIARVRPENTASVELLKNLGFEQHSSDCFLRPYFV